MTFQTSLFNIGCEQLLNYFKQLLKKNSNVMRPVDLLDLIYMEDDSSTEDYPSSSSFKQQQLPQKTRDELQVIANWLDRCSVPRREYMILYADERSDVTLKSLQMLKDHQKRSSWGNETMVWVPVNF